MPVRPVVYNKRKPHPPDAIMVDRSSQWGNPFLMTETGMRDEVCDKFAEYAIWRLSVEPLWLRPLRGKNLLCWCAPLRCHADTLVQLANPPEAQ